MLNEKANNVKNEKKSKLKLKSSLIIKKLQCNPNTKKIYSFQVSSGVEYSAFPMKFLDGKNGGYAIQFKMMKLKVQYVEYYFKHRPVSTAALIELTS